MRIVGAFIIIAISIFLIGKLGWLLGIGASVLAAAAFFAFNIYSSTTALARITAKHYARMRLRGASHDEAIETVIMTRVSDPHRAAEVDDLYQYAYRWGNSGLMPVWDELYRLALAFHIIENKTSGDTLEWVKKRILKTVYQFQLKYGDMGEGETWGSVMSPSRNE